MKTGNKGDAPATDAKAAPKEAKAPKIEVMKSQALLDLATPLFDGFPIEPSLCGQNEIKLRMSHESRNMSCYVRHTRKGLLLQLPKNKLDLIVGASLKDHRDRETQRQTVYLFEDMTGLTKAFTAAAEAHSIEAPVAVKARPAKKDKTAKAAGDAPVAAEGDVPAPKGKVREQADISKAS